MNLSKGIVLAVVVAVFSAQAGESPLWREAEWISAKDAPVRAETRSSGGASDRAADGTSWFVTSKVNAGRVVKAEWMTTALGTYELYVNGKPVGDDFLKPGCTQVQKTRRSFSYDVTGMMDVAKGAENFFAAEVSSGWWRDKVARFAGRKSAFRSILVFTFEDGSRTVWGTDPRTWKAGTAGPVVHAAIYDGEEHDARLVPPFRGEGLGEAEVNGEFKGVVLPSEGAEVCLRKDLAMVRGPYALKAGEKLVVDFGQNCAAVPFFRFKAPKGTVLTFLPAEMLNDADAPARGCDGKKGTVYRANLRNPANAFRCVYTFGPSDGFVEYHPRFTFFGYRYAEISATGDVEIESVMSVPVTSVKREMETGSLKTGDRDVNRLVANVYWGMLSNYLSVPTDCPQRDERHGWTGDTQVFAETGAFFADTSSFFRKWLADLRDSQGEEGAYASVAPSVPAHRMRFGWADAGVIVPWTVWKMFGDRQALDEHWASMEKYVAYVDATRFDYDAIAELCGKVQYSDWVSLERYGDERNVFVNGWATGPKPDAKVFWNFLGACYWRYDALLMRDMAAATGRDATRYEEMAERAKRYLRERFFVAGGKFRPEVAGLQSTMLFALKLGLLEGNEKEAMKAELRANVAANHGCLKTGFLGTSILLDTLSENGMSDLAWDILLNHDFPGWLYSVDQGATTIWERWNSYTKKSGFGPASMNSFNHYAYGAVAGWIWKTAAGIAADVSAPGFRRIRLAPVPDRRLGFIDARLRTRFGVVKSTWRYEGEKWIWDFSVPSGVTAEVLVPGTAVPQDYDAGDHRIVREQK